MQRPTAELLPSGWKRTTKQNWCRHGHPEHVTSEPPIIVNWVQPSSVGRPANTPCRPTRHGGRPLQRGGRLAKDLRSREACMRCLCHDRQGSSSIQLVDQVRISPVPSPGGPIRRRRQGHVRRIRRNDLLLRTEIDSALLALLSVLSETDCRIVDVRTHKAGDPERVVPVPFCLPAGSRSGPELATEINRRRDAGQRLAGQGLNSTSYRRTPAQTSSFYGRSGWDNLRNPPAPSASRFWRTPDQRAGLQRHRVLEFRGTLCRGFRVGGDGLDEGVQIILQTRAGMCSLQPAHTDGAADRNQFQRPAAARPRCSETS